MPTNIKTWIISIKLKNILFLKHIIALFAQVVSSVISPISYYKALNWLFLAIKTFAIPVLGIICKNIVFIY